MSQSYESADQSQSEREWTSEIHEMRRRCIAVRQELPESQTHTPTVDIAGAVPEGVKVYNRVLQQFAAQLRPKLVDERYVTEGDDRAADALWTEDGPTVRGPLFQEVVHTVNVGETNVHGELNTGDLLAKLPRAEQPVALADLRDWRTGQCEVKITYRDRTGRHRDELRSYPVYLPAWALDELRDRLDLCLDILDWLPDAGEKDVESGLHDPHRE